MSAVIAHLRQCEQGLYCTEKQAHNFQSQPICSHQWLSCVYCQFLCAKAQDRQTHQNKFISDKSNLKIYGISCLKNSDLLRL